MYIQTIRLIIASEIPILLYIISNVFFNFNEIIFFPFISYRSRDEIQNVRKTQDPIASLKERMLSTELATTDDIKVSKMDDLALTQLTYMADRSI